MRGHIFRVRRNIWREENSICSFFSWSVRAHRKGGPGISARQKTKEDADELEDGERERERKRDALSLLCVFFITLYEEH